GTLAHELQQALALGGRGALPRTPIIVCPWLRPPEGEDAWSLLAAEASVRRARSQDQLVELLAVALHRREADLTVEEKEQLQTNHEHDPALARKSVLIVDDDVRNIFALTALLEQHRIDVSYSETGPDALHKLEQGASFDIVLMDIMMPEM